MGRRGGRKGGKGRKLSRTSFPVFSDAQLSQLIKKLQDKCIKRLLRHVSLLTMGENGRFCEFDVNADRFRIFELKDDRLREELLWEVRE